MKRRGAMVAGERLAAAGMLLLGVVGAHPARAQATDAMLPPREEREDVCRFVAATPAEARLDYVIHTGVFDVNNDGVADVVSRVASAAEIGRDRFELATLDGYPLAVEPEGFKPEDLPARGAGWLPYKGRLYALHFTDQSGLFLSHLTYIRPDNRQSLICTFDNTVTAAMRTAAAREGPETALCAAIAEGHPPPYVEVTPADAAALQAWAEQSSRPDTTLLGTVAVDFDNDEEVETLALLHYAAAGEPACEFDYYDLLVEPGRVAEEGEAHAQLMRLQRLRDPKSPRFGAVCAGTRARWLESHGAVYLETRYTGDKPREKQQLFHDVQALEDGEVRRICTTDFTLQGAVKEVVEPSAIPPVEGLTPPAAE